MSSDLDDANTAAAEDFPASDCDSAQEACPKRPGFLARKWGNVQAKIRKLFDPDTWEGLKIMKDNSGALPLIVNAPGMAVDAVFYRFNKIMEEDGLVEKKAESGDD